MRNRENAKRMTLEWKRARPHVLHGYYRASLEKRPWINSFFSAKSRAKRNDWQFDLTDEWAKEAYTGGCALTGVPFRPSNYKFNPYSPTIDRIVPEVGYIQTNCRFVLFCVNSFKATLSDEEMLEIAKKLLGKSK